jgi:hypothetical protein
MVTAPTWCGTRCDIVASGRLYDRPNRVHDDRWLVDRHDVTGLPGDDQTPSF